MQPNLNFLGDNFNESLPYKKALLLLHTVVLSYNSLEDSEKAILEHLAEKENVSNELLWALDFVNEDLYSAFQRMIDYFSENLAQAPRKSKLEILSITWKSVQSKGAISEVEALALLKTARFFGIESDFVNLIRKS